MRKLLFAVLAAIGVAATVVPSAGAQSNPVISDNVKLLTVVPDSQAISGEFSTTGNFFYTSSLDSITVFDISDPRNPRMRGVLDNLVFENEAMTYGERVVGGVLNRFVLVGNDLYNAQLSARPERGTLGEVGGGEVLLIDVTDPAKPTLRDRSPAPGSDGMVEGQIVSSTHTVQCLTTSCVYAYTAGDNGRFSILDLSNLDDIRQVKTVESPAAKSRFDAGHYWDFDGSGIGWHTGGGGIAAFDVTDPLNPRLLNSSSQAGTSMRGGANDLNDFILHNSMRPNPSAFGRSLQPSLAAGNVLLVTEEDYFDQNDRDELDCSQAGSFETWYVPSLFGQDPKADSGTGTITPLDAFNINPVGSLQSPVGGFCSAHWFDYHQTGIIAQGFYQQGLRFLDVRDPQDIKEYGRFVPQAGEMWDAYWVPQRDAAGVPTAKKSNIVYGVDLAVGLYVLEVALPGQELDPIVPEARIPLLLPVAGAGLLAGALVMRRRRLAAV